MSLAAADEEVLDDDHFRRRLVQHVQRLQSAEESEAAAPAPAGQNRPCRRRMTSYQKSDSIN